MTGRFADHRVSGSGGAGPLEPSNPAITASSARPMLSQVARSGVAGEILGAIEPYSEADLAALLANLLVMVGHLAGNHPYMYAGHVKHPARLYVAVVGDTAKARKGTARSTVHSHLPFATELHITRGVGSGEGLIEALGEVRFYYQRGRAVLVVEEEMSRALRVMSRDGSTLSQVLRSGWDGSSLAVTTRRNPIKVDDASVSFIGETTVEELSSTMRPIEMLNGFGNRVLWVWASRSKVLPDGGIVPDDHRKFIQERLQRAIDSRYGAMSYTEHRAGVESGQIVRSPEAEELWDEIYRELSVPQPGLVGAITARAEAQVLRLSIAYALLDCSTVVETRHLLAARGFWDYCEASARFIFDKPSVDQARQRILHAVSSAGRNGITKTELDDAMSRHLDRKRLGELIDSGLIVSLKRRGETGRPAEVLIAAEHADKVPEVDAG